MTDKCGINFFSENEKEIRYLKEKQKIKDTKLEKMKFKYGWGREWKKIKNRI